MNSIYTKIIYITKEEGLLIFIKRVISYFKFLFFISFYIKKITLESYNRIKDVYKNERIFILGNGPSLNNTPLHILENEKVLCTNRFNLMLERLNYTPEFYACIDDRVLSTIQNDIQEISQKVDYVFLPLIHPSSGKNFYKIYKNIKNVYWLILNKFGYSLDMPYIGINKSVTNCSLQIAAFMGFKEIYLLGVDLDYEDHKSVKKENRRDWTSENDDDPNHFDPRYFGKGTKYHHPRLDETFKKWEEAKEFFEKNGVKIYNATVGGKLEIFERVNLKDVIEISDKEEMLLFLKKFNITEYISLNLKDYFPNAKIIQSEQSIDNSNAQIITDTKTAVKLIPKVIFDYIPYGPVFNQYIFIKRENKLNDT